MEREVLALEQDRGAPNAPPLRTEITNLVDGPPKEDVAAVDRGELGKLLLRFELSPFRLREGAGEQVRDKTPAALHDGYYRPVSIGGRLERGHVLVQEDAGAQGEIEKQRTRLDAEGAPCGLGAPGEPGLRPLKLGREIADEIAQVPLVAAEVGSDPGAAFVHQLESEALVRAD